MTLLFRSILQPRPSLRFISKSVVRQDVPKPTAADATKHPQSTATINKRISNLDRKILVWSKRYKSVEDIPAEVPLQTLERAKSVFRIRVANFMILGTVILCFCYAYSGKKAAERGESVTKMNVEWHREQSLKPDDSK